jgi:hypothetical protein
MSSSYQDNYVYPSGNAYRGGMLANGKRHGVGTLTWKDGATYSGDWAMDEMCGSGTLSFPNQSSFSGTFAANAPSGYGRFTTLHGEVLEGTWVLQGRSGNTSRALGPVLKYIFHGNVFNASSGKQVEYHGPASIHLFSGLCALPGMTDLNAYVLPYAMAVPASSGDLGKKLLAEAIGSSEVPQAVSVTPGIAYGYQDPAFEARHPEDHAQYDLLDWRFWAPLWLVAPSIFSSPANVNKQRQEEIHRERAVRGSNAPGS